VAMTACSGLEEGENGVVAIEVETPAFQNLEVGEQVQMVARALWVDGQVVDAAIDWRSSNAAVSVDAAGLVTGAAEGQADVQAAVGSLASERVTFTVLARADTIIIVGDSVLTIPIGADPPVPATLTVRLESFTPPKPLSGRDVIFEITSPVPGTTPTVQLVGGVQSDTIDTSAEGTASVTVEPVSGQIPPDTAIVQVRAERTRGAVVPGSGQRFIVLFQ
jgi:hypothetical protein